MNDQKDHSTLDLFESTILPEVLSRQVRRNIRIAGRQIKTTPVFEAYWYFAAERQRIFFRRLHRHNSSEFTSDPILASYRFTNSYRASDRVSQYLIREVIFGSNTPQDPINLFFRILLFKLFNKIDTWTDIEREIGVVDYLNFNFSRINDLLTRRKASGLRNYSAAYIMPSCGRLFDEQSKHTGHLKLLEWMLDQDYPARLADCQSMAEAFKLLKGVPSLGPFLSYQFVTDLNYSALTNFSEMEFVVAGPGALDGISKCFEDLGDVAAEEIIRYMAEHQSEYLGEIAGTFEDLWGRPLQLIDCQNIFCEISKYSRVAFPQINGRSGRTRIKQKYRPAGQMTMPFYPPAWNLNEKISASFS